MTMELARKRAAIARDWKGYAPFVAGGFYKLLPDAKVYFFGSAVRGDMAGGSDVDVLVVSSRLPKGAVAKAGLKVKVEELAGLPDCHPFDIHLVTESEARPFLRRAGEDVIFFSRERLAQYRALERRLHVRGRPRGDRLPSR